MLVNKVLSILLKIHSILILLKNIIELERFDGERSTSGKKDDCVILQAMAFNAIQTQRCVNLVKRNQAGSKTAVSAV